MTLHLFFNKSMLEKIRYCQPMSYDWKCPFKTLRNHRVIFSSFCCQHDIFWSGEIRNSAENCYFKNWSKGFIFAELTFPLREHTQLKKIRQEIVPFHIFILSNKSIDQTTSFKNWSKVTVLMDVKFHSLHTLQKQ